MSAGDVAPREHHTISTDPIASGASAPAPALFVAIPTVNTNRNMPTNSTTSFR